MKPSRWLSVAPFVAAALVWSLPALADSGSTPAPAADAAASPSKPTSPETAPADAPVQPGTTPETTKAVDGEAPAPKAESEEAPKPEDAWKTAEAVHRGGFTVGLATAAGLGAANGFPNDSKKIGLARHYTETGLGFAPSSSLWIGGTFDDFLTVGAGGGFSTIMTGDTQSASPAMFFHVDIFPLFPLGGQLKNLGVMTELGLGFPETIETETEEILIDGGGSSYVFLGAFWEGIEAWKLKMGPYSGVHYMFSQSVRRPIATLGFRISLYVEP